MVRLRPKINEHVSNQSYILKCVHKICTGILPIFDLYICHGTHYESPIEVHGRPWKLLR